MPCSPSAIILCSPCGREEGSASIQPQPSRPVAATIKTGSRLGKTESEDLADAAGGEVFAGTTAPATRQQQLATAGLITAIWLLAELRWLISDTVVPWDSKNQIYAFFRFLALALHSGAMPFWNPFHYGGHPSVADPQSLVFAPGFMLWALLDPAPSLHAFDLLVFAHLLIGALALGVIGLRARWPVSACVLAASVFMFGGAAAARLQHSVQILSYGEFPLALLLLQMALERRSFLLSIAFAVVAAILALGRSQAALLLCYLLIAVALAEIVCAKQPLTYLRLRLPMLLTMAVVGLLLLGPPLLLTIQFADLSNRPAELLSDAYQGSLYPANLATLTVADIFGTHGPHSWGPDPSTVPDLVNTDEAFNYMFVGWVPLLLLLWFGVIGGGAWRRGRRLLSVALVVAVLYMLGRYTPFFALAFKYVPGVAEFRRAVDGNYMFDAVLAILIGYLLTDYVRNGLPPRRILLSGACAAVTVGMLVWGVTFSELTGHGSDALRAILTVAPIPLIAIMVLTLARTERARSRAAIAVTIIAVAELIGWNVAFRLNAEPRAVYSVLEQPTGADAHALAVLKHAIDIQHASGERPRVEVLGISGPWQNVPMVQGIEAISGYNPMRIGTVDRLVAPPESNWLMDLRDFPPTFDSYDSPLARALGLKYLVLGGPINAIPNIGHVPVATIVLAGPPIWIYELPGTMPRVTFSDHVRFADADATGPAGRLVASPEPGSVLIDTHTPPTHRYRATAAQGHAQIVGWGIDAIDINADSKDGGILVLHDIYYPGWVAAIDGHKVPILRADVLFRGVEVPPGHHRVHFAYVPFSFENLQAALLTALHGTP